jgi:hypothetical protein
MTVLPSVRCPSDVGGDLNEDRKYLIFPPLDLSLPRANYVGNHGISGHQAFWVRGDGVFGPNSDISIAEIIDGTSNTFLVGERHSVNNAHGALYWGSGWFPQRLNSLGPIGFYPATPGAVLSGTSILTPMNKDLNTGLFRLAFSSLHVGGAQFLMCDGAVRYVNENIQHSQMGGCGIPAQFCYALQGVYQRLGVRNDQQVIDQF